MNRVLSAVPALLAVTVLAACQNLPFGQSGWTTLIEGERGLENWTRVGGNANWRAEDGAIVADRKTDKPASFLLSRNSYKDFQTRIEFWASHDANSGIFMRCQNPAQITDKSCYEANIFDQRPDPTYGTGAIVHLAPVNPMPKAGGKWNVYDITVKGDKVTVTLNGQRTVELQDRKFASGPFALQYGAGVVKFRKVQIRPL
ncbi:MAG TPA: DUF1080 domain-containing protein [Burkholderiales bacterium]